MKRITLAIVALVAALGIGASATLATWTHTVTVTNNIISTGTVDLEVSTNNFPGGAGIWNATTASSTMVISGLVPTAVLPVSGTYSFSLWNKGTAGPLTLTGQITSDTIAPNNGVDRSKLLVQMFLVGTNTAVSNELPLTTWETTPQVFLVNPLAQGSTVDYEFRARLDPTADNSWQGQTATFTMSVTGSTP